MTDARHLRPRAPWTAPLRQLAVIFGLSGFAISQPVLGLLGDNPTVLAHHGLDGGSMVVLAVLIALVPPLALWTVPAVIAIRARGAGGLAHLAVVTFLAGCVAIQLVKAVGIESGVVVAVVAAGIGVAFAAVYAHVHWVATWASYTAFLPVLAVGFMLFASPASALLQEVAAPERVSEGAAPVVLIVLDELPTRSLLTPDELLDSDRVPNLSRFAEDATWYRHHTTVAPLTSIAVPSLLTGTEPRAVQPLWTEHPDNLFSLLAPTHELEVMETATLLCPYDSCAPTTAEGEALAVARPGFADAIGLSWDLWRERVRPGPSPASRLDDFAEEVVTSSADLASATPNPQATAIPDDGRGLTPDPDAMRASSAKADAFLTSLDPGKGSALYYLHLLLPHQPWTFHPDGLIYTEVDPTGYTLPADDASIRFSWSEWHATISEQRHLLQLQYTDQLVGQVMDQLRAVGLFDESLVIVVSDHGFSFEPRTPPRRAGEDTLDAIAYAPLLVKMPRQTEGAIDDRNVNTLDVLPTIAAAMDVEVPWRVEGVPVFSEEAAARDGTKVIWDMTGLGEVTDHGTLTFDDDVRFGEVAAGRHVGPLTDPADPLSGLPAPEGTASMLGQAVSDLDIERVGEADVLGLPEIEDSRGVDPIGLVEAILLDAPPGPALLAVDGTVVAASAAPADTDGRRRLAFLLPAGTLHAEHQVQILIVRSDGTFADLALS